MLSIYNAFLSVEELMFSFKKKSVAAAKLHISSRHKYRGYRYYFISGAFESEFFSSSYLKGIIEL